MMKTVTSALIICATATVIATADYITSPVANFISGPDGSFISSVGSNGEQSGGFPQAYRYLGSGVAYAPQYSYLTPNGNNGGYGYASVPYGAGPVSYNSHTYSGPGVYSANRGVLGDKSQDTVISGPSGTIRTSRNSYEPFHSSY